MNSFFNFMIIFVIICGCNTTEYEEIKNNNNTEVIKQNKTKRTIPDQIYNYGGAGPKSVILYAPADNVAASNEFTNVPRAFAFIPAATSALKTAVFDSEVPKQVAAQQVLYEYQQTPTNAVSNVHVNQYLQPISQQSYKQPTEIVNYHHNHHHSQHQQGIVNNVDSGLSGVGHNQQTQSGSENFATPAQHSSLIHHGQNFALVQFPQAPTHTQTQHYIPGKYLYVNGKIVYQPNQILSTGHINQNVRPVTFQHQQYPQQQPQQVSQRKPYGYFGYAPQFTLKPKVNSPLSLPISSQQQRPLLNSFNNNFNPPQKQHLQQIIKPISSPAPVIKQAEVTERTAFNENKDDEDDEDDKSTYNKENDETEENEETGEINTDYHHDKSEDDDEENDRGFFNKYAFDEDDDDDDDHRKYREDDPIEESYDEDDNSRDSSKQIISQKKLKKSKPMKYSKSSSYKYIDNYGNKYNIKPKKKSLKHKGTKPTKMHYKNIKYSKTLNNKNHKPKGDGIEGKQSEHIPVIHKHKFVQHKWFVSKVDNSDP